MKKTPEEQHQFAKDLESKFGECLISDDSGDENNPYDYWLQDVTVLDIVDFCKTYGNNSES